MFLPTLAFAQSFDLGGSNFRGVIYYILDAILVLIPIMFALAFIVFFWGLSKFILHSDNAADIKKGKNYMFWGIIALFVLLSFRAIISFVSSDLDLGNSSVAPLLPSSYIGSDIT